MTWYKDAVGGLWDQMGPLQFNFLLSKGLKPHHKFMDVGCGSGRAGRLLVNYLDNNKYIGIDHNQKLLDAFRSHTEGEYELIHTSSFCAPYHHDVDFGIAQSVLTHLELDEVKSCLSRVADHFRPGGKFFITYFIPDGPQPFQTFPAKDPYHYDTWHMETMAKVRGWDTNFIGDWNHPRGQQMMELTRKSD